MKKILVTIIALSALSACCPCPKDTPEVAQAKQVANDFKLLLHKQEDFIAKNNSCTSDLNKLDEAIVNRYKGNIAIDRTCNMLVKKDNLLLRAKADPVNGYTLYSCGPMGLFLTSEGFVRNCGNIDTPSAIKTKKTEQKPAAPAKK